MLVNTKHFGQIDLDENKVITFDNGIMGFEEYKKYTILYDEEEGDKPSISWLQSIDIPDLALPIINPLLIKEDYNISFWSFRPEFFSVSIIMGVVLLRRHFRVHTFRFRQPPTALYSLSYPPTAPRSPCGCRRRCTGFPSASSGPLLASSRSALSVCRTSPPSLSPSPLQVPF